MTFEDVMRSIEYSDNEILSLMSGMISIPAISPALGGEGEKKRADFLKMFLGGFDTVKEFEYESQEHPGIKRSSIAAIKKGRLPQTFWILSHIDTVPIGERSEWDSDPFRLTVEDGRMYGRGTEDDGQAVVASIIASQKFLRTEMTGMSLGLLLVGDEEVGSKYGLERFMDSGIFKKGDTFLIPDTGEEGNNVISVMEKTVFWIMGKVTGKAAHGSSPSEGHNPIPPTMELIKDIEKLSEVFSQRNEGFREPHATFTPTRLSVSPGGINAIPSHVDFAFDCRLIPGVHSVNVREELDKIYAKHKAANPKFKYEYELQIEHAGSPSSTETETFKILAKAIKDIIGKEPKVSGPNGATCASLLRQRGYDCYGWVMHQGHEHQPNEFITVDDVKADAKVFATMINWLCYE